jgi:hypothetical protein
MIYGSKEAMSKTRPQFDVRLQAPDDPSDEDATRRLRNTLKGLLRRFGWKCIEARRVDHSETHDNGMRNQPALERADCGPRGQ